MADPVLVLRPEPGAARTAEALKRLGFVPILYPLYAIEPVAWVPPAADGFDALLITSANALREGGPALSAYRALPLFAVGEATAALARQMGFAALRTGGGDLASTLPMLAGAGHAHILHLSGTEVREGDAAGLSITRIPVYRTVPRGDGAGLLHALPRDRGAFALIHSPRAGARLSDLVTDAAERDRLSLIAISPAASEACGTGWRDRVAAGEPTEAAMLAGLQMLV